MDYPLCLRSSKPKFPRIISNSITKNVISATKISTKPILFLPKYHFLTKSIIMNNNHNNNKHKSHFCANYIRLYPRASLGDHPGNDDMATIINHGSIPTAAARGPGASIAAAACILGAVLCCSAALMIGPQKAAAASWLGLNSTVCESCGGSGSQSFSDEHRKYSTVVISLSKVKRYFDQREFDSSNIKDFDQPKKKALRRIKEGENIEKALVRMFQERHMRGSQEFIKADYEFKIAHLEILIAQGNFNKAFEVLKSLERDHVEFPPSDRRPILYQAIIYSIRYDKDRPPEKYWEKFFEDDDSPAPPMIQ